ncbi:MAG: hypothetical protein JZD41_05905 [Thermoproteus sp.]|nr:hypothetical protein [Thermoproteus sp.]
MKAFVPSSASLVEWTTPYSADSLGVFLNELAKTHDYVEGMRSSRKRPYLRTVKKPSFTHS